MFLSFSEICFAQEYKYEIGGMAGTAFYMGDANKTALFKNMNLGAGAVFRYNRDFRWAYKANLAVGGVSGDTRKSGNAFPDGQDVSFSRTFIELGGQIEFNFFAYSDKYAYLGTKRISPYLFTGLGITAATGDDMFLGLNIPIGMGVKYKLKDRLNIGFEFSLRKLFGDSFDKPKKDGFGLEDPYEIKSSFLKNKDWYSLTMFTITWDFGLRGDPCRNLSY
ncbi:DUF6089 family protein [Dysgonomonas sp. 216]|uniref:type IX secretion system protein PorG n=1 Tax=Dysgonomonas sp. 216 TaxID=2302934 RepID=UPI0021080C26|nr:DUF6089 family protein [Dysgonomonas sp. 216]